MVHFYWTKRGPYKRAPLYLQSNKSEENMYQMHLINPVPTCGTPPTFVCSQRYPSGRCGPTEVHFHVNGDKK